MMIIYVEVGVVADESVPHRRRTASGFSDRIHTQETPKATTAAVSIVLDAKDIVFDPDDDHHRPLDEPVTITMENTGRRCTTSRSTHSTSTSM